MQSKGTDSNRESKEVFSEKVIIQEREVDFKELLWHKLEIMINGFSYEHVGYLCQKEVENMLRSKKIFEQHLKLL